MDMERPWGKRQGDGMSNLLDAFSGLFGGNSNKVQREAIKQQQLQLQSDQGKQLALEAQQQAKSDTEVAALNKPDRGRRLLLSSQTNGQPATLGG